jgi:hypothetical protein
MKLSSQAEILTHIGTRISRAIAVWPRLSAAVSIQSN